MNTKQDISVIDEANQIMKLIGHHSTKTQIEIASMSAIKRNSSLPHMLFTGVAGCGKTSMARFVASNNKTGFMSVPAQKFKDFNSVTSILEKLDHTGYDEMGNRISKITPTILFVDEIHRMPITGEEYLGIAMEEFRLPSEDGNGYYWIPYFTLIGATTDDGGLSKPFRERFKMRFVFNTYSNDEMSEIVSYHAKRPGINIPITPKAIRSLAKRGRGVPRIVLGYLERARDLALSLGEPPVITSYVVEEMFRKMGVDEEGLTLPELKILKTLYDSKVPIGLDNLSIIVNESPKTLQASSEPFLVRKGYIIRSGKGRIITKKGKRYVASKMENAGKKWKAIIPANYTRT